MMQRRRVGAILLPLSLLAGGGLAQQPSALRVPAVIGQFTPATPAHANSASVSGLLGPGDLDYRYTGLYVGLGVGALFVAYGIGLASESEGGVDTNRLLIGLPLIAAFFGGSGALIGTLFPKARAEQPAEPQQVQE